VDNYGHKAIDEVDVVVGYHFYLPIIYRSSP